MRCFNMQAGLYVEPTRCLCTSCSSGPCLAFRDYFCMSSEQLHLIHTCSCCIIILRCIISDHNIAPWTVHIESHASESDPVRLDLAMFLMYQERSAVGMRTCHCRTPVLENHGDDEADKITTHVHRKLLSLDQ